MSTSATNGGAIAGFWPRVAASYVDGFVIASVTFPTTLLIGYGPAWGAIGFILLTAPVGWLYTTVSHARFGQTLGKHILGLRVVRADDLRAIGYREAVRRDVPSIVFSLLSGLLLVRIVVSGETAAFRMFEMPEIRYEEGEEITLKDAFAPWAKALEPYDPLFLATIALSEVWFLAEVATMLTNRRRRAVHDFLGGTVVVQDQQAVPAMPATPASAPAARLPESAHPPKPPGKGW